MQTAADYEHTPGPWVTDAKTGHESVYAKGRLVADCAIFGAGAKAETNRANAALVATAPTFADIARRAQRAANEAGGDYGDLSHDELCEFMVEFDRALDQAEAA